MTAAFFIFLSVAGIIFIYGVFRYIAITKISKFSEKAIIVKSSYIEEKCIPARMEEVILYRPVLEFIFSENSLDLVKTIDGFKPNMFWYAQKEQAEKVLNKGLRNSTAYVNNDKTTEFVISPDIPARYKQTTLSLIAASVLMFLISVLVAPN